MTELLTGVAVFTGLVLALVALILAARRWLVPTGDVLVRVNGQRDLLVPLGVRLGAALAGAGIQVPAACGGRGTCGQCRLIVSAGGGEVVPVEEALLSPQERSRGVRLACQVTLREPLSVELPAEILGVRRWTCRVRSNRNVSTSLKELVLELPPGSSLEFQAGAYVQVVCPPHRTPFETIEVQPPYDEAWERLGLRRLVAASDVPQTRAYSLANPPAEDRVLSLLVRIATPPPGAGRALPPGVVSSWLFARKVGETVSVSGPFGTFRVSDSAREMVFVGGGAGMAPLRSMILDQLETVATTRAISFWYGARSLAELPYRESFERLAAEHDGFQWCAALSDPLPDDDWSGERGFIHEVLLRRHLAGHPAPEECEYYLCGPPLMVRAVLATLAELGVERDRIRFDDFGS